MKKCSKCKKIKKYQSFYLDKQRKDKLTSVCKICHTNYYKNNRNRILEKYVERYNISIHDFRLLLEKQNNKCAICFNTQNRKRRLAIDHCHKTNKVRGLLCDKCNFALGLVGDDISILSAMIKYIKK